jgi:hypothetical protein
LWAFGDPLPQGWVDAAAGFGDAFGASLIRDGFGIDGDINKCSREYNKGQLAGSIGYFFMPIGRLGYVAQAGNIGKLANGNARLANLMRNNLKDAYRGPLKNVLQNFNRFKHKNYDYYKSIGKTDAAIIDGAMRTSGEYTFGMVAGGALVGGYRSASSALKDCACE